MPYWSSQRTVVFCLWASANFWGNALLRNLTSVLDSFPTMVAPVRVDRHACPACSSRGLKPSRVKLPFDGLLRLFGRAPYDCLWCHRRCFLVPPEKGPELQDSPSEVVTSDVMPSEVVTSEVVTSNVVTSEVMRNDVTASELKPRPVTKTEPAAVPRPVVQPEEVPDAPMYAEKGRLRLSEMTMDQIRWRGDHLGRSAAINGGRKRQRPAS